MNFPLPPQVPQPSGDTLPIALFTVMLATSLAQGELADPQLPLLPSIQRQRQRQRRMAHFAATARGRMAVVIKVKSVKDRRRRRGRDE